MPGRVPFCYRGLLSGLLATAVGLFFSCRSLNLRLRGEIAEATVTGVERMQDDLGSPAGDTYVKYRWRDREGHECLGYDRVSDDRVADRATVRIYYIPGARMSGRTCVSRLVESSSPYPFVALGAGLLVTLLFGWLSFRHLQRQSDSL